MPIVDAELNKMQQEKQKLMRLPETDENKKLIKNLNERIRYRTNKLQGDPVEAKPIIVEKKKKVNMKNAILEEVKGGNKDVNKIVGKYGFKKASVQWYFSQLKLRK